LGSACANPATIKHNPHVNSKRRMNHLLIREHLVVQESSFIWDRIG
jgi:hypothetical protein